MTFFSSLPTICQWTALMLSIFITVKASLLFSYFQKIGTLSLYYLYASLFGLSTSVLQLAFIFTEIVELPPQLVFFKYVITLLICINFIGFMYLLWKRPHKIGLTRVTIFTALYAFVMMAIPLWEGESSQSGIMTTFNIWYFPVAAFAIVLLVAVCYYYWKIAHFKNGLSVVVISSLIPFIISALLSGLNHTTEICQAASVFYAISFLPLSIKLTMEGLHGYKYDYDSNRGSTRE